MFIMYLFYSSHYPVIIYDYDEHCCCCGCVMKGFYDGTMWTLLTLTVAESFFLDSWTVQLPVYPPDMERDVQLLDHIRPERTWVRLSLWGQLNRHSPGTALALQCTSQSILSWRANVNLSPGRQNDVPSLTQLWPSTFFARSYLVQYDVLHLQLRPSRWAGGSIIWGGTFNPSVALLQNKATTKYKPWLHSCLFMIPQKAISEVRLFNGNLFKQVWFQIIVSIVV